jgi:hypothetical protein
MTQDTRNSTAAVLRNHLWCMLTITRIMWRFSRGEDSRDCLSGDCLQRERLFTRDDNAIIK